MGFFSRPELISPGGDGSADRTRLLELEQRVARLEAQLAQLAQLAPAGYPTSPTAGTAQPAYPAQTAQQPWTGEVQALIDAGKKIHAIKLYREHTGVGLKEAKDAVEAMPGGR